MGYFDGLTDGIFKKDNQGRNLFFPWGILGSGYVVESEEERRRIRNLIKKIYVVMLPAIIIIQITLGYLPNLILFFAFCVWYYLLVKKITKGLPCSTEKLKLGEAYKSSANSYGLPTLICLELIAMAFVATGVWQLWCGNGILISSLGIGFFGLCSLVIGYMLCAKIKSK